MALTTRLSQATFAVAMLGLGALSAIYGGAALLWQAVPKTLPARAVLIYLCAAVLLAGGAGLLVRRTAAIARGVLLLFLALWLVALKLPPLLRAPGVAVNWESLAEVAVMLAGCTCLHAARAPAGAPPVATRAGRLLLVAALPMIGASHFAYAALTASLVPAWLGAPLVWAYLTGAASIAAAAGLLFGVLPRLAATLEAAMLWIITLLVWVPRFMTTPADQEVSTEFFISSAIAAGAWVVADTYRQAPWGPRRRGVPR